MERKSYIGLTRNGDGYSLIKMENDIIVVKRRNMFVNKRRRKEKTKNSFLLMSRIEQTALLITVPIVMYTIIAIILWVCSVNIYLLIGKKKTLNNMQFVKRMS